MKGIVVEINKKEAVLMTDDGLFQTVKNNHYEIGQAITAEKIKKPAARFAAAAAGIAAMLVITTTTGFAYYTPTDYVSLDVNPSIEYSVNMFDRILDAKAVNDDGEKILSDLDLTNRKLEDALKETLDKLIQEGYLTNDPDSGIVITTSNKKMNDAEDMAEHLQSDLQRYLDQHDNVTAKVNAEAVGMKRVEEARKLGVTPGKLNLVQKLQCSTEGAIDIERWLSAPVKEIDKAIKENTKQHQEMEKEQAAETKKTDQESSDSRDNKKEQSSKASFQQNQKQDTAEEKQEYKKNDSNQHPGNGGIPQEGVEPSGDKGRDPSEVPPGHEKDNREKGTSEQNKNATEDKTKEEHSNGSSGSRGSGGPND